MITMIVRLRVPPQNAASFEALMEGVCAKVREHEPDVPYYAFAKSADEPDTYVVVEVYRDPVAHAAHMQAAWVRESMPISARLIEGKPDIRQYVSEGTQPVRIGAMEASHE